jgi:hypothetical protein
LSTICHLRSLPLWPQLPISLPPPARWPAAFDQHQTLLLLLWWRQWHDWKQQLPALFWQLML